MLAQLIKDGQTVLTVAAGELPDVSMGHKRQPIINYLKSRI